VLPPFSTKSFKDEPIRHGRRGGLDFVKDLARCDKDIQQSSGKRCRSHRRSGGRRLGHGPDWFHGYSLIHPLLGKIQPKLKVKSAFFPDCLPRIPPKVGHDTSAFFTFYQTTCQIFSALFSQRLSLRRRLNNSGTHTNHAGLRCQLRLVGK